MKEIYIIRHGETLYNVERRVQGRGVNSSLNEKGRQQARAFFELYKNHNFELLITSSLNRSKETVVDFIQQHNTKHLSYDYLDEISWGIYEGKEASEDLHAEHKRVLSEWSNANYDAKIEGGESAFEMQNRLFKFLELLPSFPERKILICTHGATLGFLMTMLQNEPLSLMPNYKYHNTGLCKFIYDGENFNLLLNNDLEHLDMLS
jgi:probable phosphoglycerate mutase